MELRPYQNDAVKAILATWAQGIRATLLVLPTGTGKTIVFCRVIEEMVRRGARVLILAHREELLTQAADKLQKATGLSAALEKAESHSSETWLNVVVGSVQTLQNERRLAEFEPDDFDVVIVDEAHHAVSASYRRVLDYFSDAKLLGVTATADRGDKRNLGEVFDTVAYEYTLPAAIAENYLSPIKALTIPLEISLADCAIQSGDFALKGIATALDPYLDQIADEMKKHIGDRKTVVFLPLVATSQKFCEMLNCKGIKSREVNGESTDRHETLAAFHAGAFQVLCNSMLLTEGWDEPDVSCIVCLRPTKVRALYAQIVGRGTRLAAGKSDLLLLDFLWQSERHELCRPAHLVCDNQEISRRVAEILAEDSQGKEVDLLSDVEAATNTAQIEREEALKKLLDEQRRKKRQLVDPLQYCISIGAATTYEPAGDNLRELAPASDAQMQVLEKMGIDPSTVTCCGQASRLIDTLNNRRAAGMATPKQIRMLERYGFQQVGNWPFDKANGMICRIASNNWRLPYTIDPSEY